MNEIVGKFFYPLVVDDIDKVIDAIEYYKHVHSHGLQHTKIKGVLERMMQDQAGLMQNYEDAQTDADMVHKWLEERIKQMKAKKRIWFLTNKEAKHQYGDLKKTEVDSFIQADDEIQYTIELMFMVELWKNSLDKLVSRLKQRGIYLSMITKLRISGQREVYIDASHETNPETL
jgi:hypothetical protein